jgi:CheY-like chemotaxis protein
MARLKLSQSGDLSPAAATDLAASVGMRMARLGSTAAGLSRDAKVDRATVTAMLKGRGVQLRSVAKVTRTLDRLEQQAGIFDDEPAMPQRRLVSVEVELPRASGGTTWAVVKGEPGDVAEAVAKLLMRLPVE